MAKRTPGREVTTVFFGGGTPSLMKPATVSAILDGIARYWKVAPDAEVTLEANPTSVEAERFRGFRSAGVNRVSLGVQALDDASLKELGRLHSAEEALKAVSIARAGIRSLFLRSDLCTAGANAGGVGARTQARDRRSRRASVALSAHHRGRHAILRAACERQAGHARRRQFAHPLRHHAGNLRPVGLRRLRDFQSRASGRGMPAQSGLLARRRLCRHRSGRAWPHRRERRAASPPRPRSGRKAG